jgi:hypothetical protein
MRTVAQMAVGLALAVSALTGVHAPAAGAEGDGAPAILLLEKGAKALEATFTDTASRYERLSGTGVSFTGAEMRWKGCEAVPGSEEKDVSLCKDVLVELRGAGKCRTPGSELGVILFLVDLHLAAEKTTLGVLQPLLLARFLSKDLKEEVDILCGFVEIRLRGTLGCLLLPGLKNIAPTEEVELVCKINSALHDPEAGQCVLLCELLEHLFEVADTGPYQDAWMERTMKGKFNKDIFIDD